MNLINDLIEMGFITPSIGKTIMLHPMIQEIANLYPQAGIAIAQKILHL